MTKLEKILERVMAGMLMFATGVCGCASEQLNSSDQYVGSLESVKAFIRQHGFDKLKEISTVKDVAENSLRVALDSHTEAYYLAVQDKYKEALLSCGNAIKQGMTSNAEIYWISGFCKHKLGLHREAVEDSTRALELDPQYYQAYNSRGCAYEDLSMYKEAMKDYKKAVALNPFFSLAAANIENLKGVLLEKEGKNTEAINQYKKALEVYSNLTCAKENLARLQQKSKK